jgi:hypothetical protein
MKRFYISVIRPVLEYGGHEYICGKVGLPKSNVITFEKVQKSAVQIICSEKDHEEACGQRVANR